MKKTKKIALAALSASGAAIFLILGNTISVLDYSFYLLASLCVMLPFCYEDVLGSVLCFVASSLIGVIFVPNIMVMFPYLVFFAPYVVLMCLLLMKNVKPVLAYIIKGVFFALAIFLMYEFTSLFADMDSYQLPLALLFALAFIFLFVYDFLMMRIRRQLFKIVDNLMKRSN